MDTFELTTAATGLTVVIIAVLLHFEGLRLLTRWINRTRITPQQIRIAIMINALLALHAVEIVFFGSAYWLLHTQFGNVLNIVPLTWPDCVYFSATVYSTLGFGDVLPLGPVRFLAGIESVSGLLLITWSASFTYLEMTRFWKNTD